MRWQFDCTSFGFEFLFQAWSGDFFWYLDCPSVGYFHLIRALCIAGNRAIAHIRSISIENEFAGFALFAIVQWSEPYDIGDMVQNLLFQIKNKKKLNKRLTHDEYDKITTSTK